jgi:hypothetical protein
MAAINASVWLRSVMRNMMLSIATVSLL